MVTRSPSIRRLPVLALVAALAACARAPVEPVPTLVVLPAGPQSAPRPSASQAIEPVAAPRPAERRPERAAPRATHGDRDGDGIPDEVDRCPDDPEDRDAFEDEDGCPDPDNDRDGIPDTHDQCPNDPETLNGFEDADGCPDTRPRSP